MLQEAKFTSMTCDYHISNSINVNCTGGRYAHPNMLVETKCNPNYYLKGPSKSKCNDIKKPSCLPCSCDKTGSLDSECVDQTGVCKCKSTKYQNTKISSYYGRQCQNRDCAWELWSPWYK